MTLTKETLSRLEHKVNPSTKCSSCKMSIDLVDDKYISVHGNIRVGMEAVPFIGNDDDKISIYHPSCITNIVNKTNDSITG